MHRWSPLFPYFLQLRMTPIDCKIIQIFPYAYMENKLKALSKMDGVIYRLKIYIPSCSPWTKESISG